VVNEINAWFDYYDSKQEFSNGVASLMFGFTKNGIRSVIIFESVKAYLMHRNHTYDGGLNATALTTGLTFETGEVSGLPLEY
jgi:hypothetical protein